MDFSVFYFDRFSDILILFKINSRTLISSNITARDQRNILSGSFRERLPKSSHNVNTIPPQIFMQIVPCQDRGHHKSSYQEPHGILAQERCRHVLVEYLEEDHDVRMNTQEGNPGFIVVLEEVVEE